MITPCICGARFRSALAEARHRHNFPALCRKPKQPKRSLSLTYGELGLLKAVLELDTRRLQENARIAAKFGDARGEQVAADLAAQERALLSRVERAIDRGAGHAR